MVRNIHGREYRASPEDLGRVLDSLSSQHDLLWPVGDWPPVILSDGLKVGSQGGHVPIQYTVEAYEPGRMVRFRFTGPKGFEGTRAFAIETSGGGTVRLEHSIHMKTRWPAMLSWPIVFGPMHDALIEDALDKVAKTVDDSAFRGKPWSVWVRFMRRLTKKSALRKLQAEISKREAD